MPGPLDASSIASSSSLHMDRTPIVRGVLGKIPLQEIKNEPGFLRCRLAYTPGMYERMANADAMQSACEVMRDGVGSQSDSAAAALKRTLQLFGQSSAAQVGPVLVENLTAMGAARAGLVELMRNPSQQANLAPLLKKLDASIVDIGVKAGKCKGIPDAVRRDDTSKDLCKAVRAGKQVMLECAEKVGGTELLRGVAQSILPRAIMRSLEERLPHLVEKFKSAEGSAALTEVLHAQAAHKLEQRLVENLDQGGAEALNGAILNLLKTPEYVVQGDPGRAGEPPAPPAHSDLPPDLQRLAQESIKHGGCVNINHNDFNDLFKLLDKPPLQLSDLRNLLNDVREDAFERGRLTEIVRNRDEYIDKLERRLLETQERLEKFANGNGQTRVPQGDRIQVDVEDKATSTDDLTSRNDDQKRPVRADGSANTDPAPPVPPRGVNAGNGDGVVRADQETQFEQRNQLDKRNQFDQRNQNAPNSQNGEGAQHLRRNVDSQGNQKNENNQNNQNNRNDQQLHKASNNILPPDGNLDRIPHQENQHRLGNPLLHGEDQTDGSDRQLKREQRLGDSQLWQNVGTGVNRSVKPDDGTSVVGELVRYLQAVGTRERSGRGDPYEPIGPRRVNQRDDDATASGLSPNLLLRPSDLAEYVERQGENSGIPFVPFRTGPVKEPAAAPLDEFLELIQRHGQGNVTPKHALDRNHRSPAPQTPITIRERPSDLEGVLERVRLKQWGRGARVAIPVVPSQLLAPTAAPVSPQLAASRATASAIPDAPGADARLIDYARLSAPPLVMGGEQDCVRRNAVPKPSGTPELSLLARSTSAVSGTGHTQAPRSRGGAIASLFSVSGRTYPSRDQVLIDSRSPGGKVPRQVRFDDALGSLRGDESIIVDPTPRGPTQSAESAPSVPNRATPTPLETARTSLPFTRSVSQLSVDSDDGIDAERNNAELAAFRAKQWERFREEFGPGWGEPASGAASSISSSESSEADRVLEDFSEIESISDAADTAAEWQRTESRDSGNDSPTRFAHANWEAQPVARVADLETAEPKSAHKVELARIVDLPRARKLKEEAERESAPTQNEEASWDPQPVARVGTPIDPRAAFMADLERVIQQRAAP